LVSVLIVFGVMTLLGCQGPKNELPKQTAWKNNKEFTNSIGMKLVRIPKGTFTMGAPAGEKDRMNRETPHQVTLTKDFYLGVTEVTQAQYEKVMRRNPSHFQGRSLEGDSSNQPVDSVTWRQAADFCKKLSELPEELAAGRVYRLPTEAEWEYACRAGTKTAFNFGDDEILLGEYSWFNENSDAQSHPVGLKKPNAWGLHDMHGNVWEWCVDAVRPYQPGTFTDPLSNSGYGMGLRGGSWEYFAKYHRSAYRHLGKPTQQHPTFGFRVVLSLPAEQN
jgi:formylglycine-generating enzyme required for sulfatase activity